MPTPIPRAEKKPRIAVQISTRNPRRDVLAKVLDALKRQTLDPTDWQLVVVDNASTNNVIESLDFSGFVDPILLREERPGVLFARWKGFLNCRAPIMVLIDDDTVAAPDFLERAIAKMAEYPQVGVMGGSVDFGGDAKPEPFAEPFHFIYAIRKEPEQDRITDGYKPGDSVPVFAPPGAGMVVRMEAAMEWVRRVEERFAARPGYKPVNSSEDNDIMISAARAGWRIAQVRGLHLEHHIAPERMTRKALGDLLQRSMREWVLMCREHDLVPRPPVPRFLVPVLKLRQWFLIRPWQSDHQYLMWRNYCGEAEGRGLYRSWP